MSAHSFRLPSRINTFVLCGVMLAAVITAAQSPGNPPPCANCTRAEAFMKLPPAERVRIWFKDMNKGASATGLSSNDDYALLVSLGLDTVPTLANIVHTAGINQQIDAVSLLCHMDRFVPVAELPAPEPFGHIGPYLGSGFHGPFLDQPYERYQGEYNPYMTVDGRRIGPQGLEAVQWAANQTKNRKLRTFARDCSGLVSQDLRRLGTPDLLATWRKGVIAGLVPGTFFHVINLDNEFLPAAEGILVQRAEESIPLLARIVMDDQEQEVRVRARDLLLRIDLEKVRLRGSEAGRSAIAALTESARTHPLAEWRLLARTSAPLAEQSHREFIEAVEAQTMQDTVLRGEPPFGWMARAFADLYGEPTTFLKRTAMASYTDVRPEFRQFIAWLTRTDAAFPDWECSSTVVSAPQDQMTELVKPCFKARIERLHQAWLRYRATIAGI
jgi:hypothetical protein